MFYTSASDYIKFFERVRQNIEPLEKGKIKKVNFDASIAAYYLIVILGTVAFYFFNIVLVEVSSSSIILRLILFPVGYFIFFTVVAALLRLNYYLLQERETSFLRVWYHNIWCISKFLAPQYFQQYPDIKPFDEKIALANPKNLEVLRESDFALFLGTSTGLFTELWHTTSLAKNQNVFLSASDAAKNILVLGGIGSGKTSAVIQPLMLQLFYLGCGGLIFDIKGDVKATAINFAQNTDRHIHVLGPLKSKFNLLHNLTPETASSFLKSSLLLHGNDTADRFWVDTATELSRNVLGLLSFIPKFYTLNDLYQYIFDIDSYNFLEEKLSEAKEGLSSEQKRLFNAYHRYKTTIFDSFDEKIKSGVRATLSQAISPFNHPDFIDAFCSREDINIEKILDGDIFLVDMPIATWGLGAKVAYTFIKLRFYNLMQRHHNASNRLLPVFFICDEFQEIVSCNKDGLSDLNFWDKARSSKTIGIISAQSIASFFAATPSRDYAYALLQNFRNKICLASEDPLTIEYISTLTGKARTQKRSMSSGQHGSHTTSEARDDVLEAQVFRSLSPESALALLTIGNLSRDDALMLHPIYLEEKGEEENALGKNLKAAIGVNNCGGGSKLIKSRVKYAAWQ